MTGGFKNYSTIQEVVTQSEVQDSFLSEQQWEVHRYNGIGMKRADSVQKVKRGC